MIWRSVGLVVESVVGLLFGLLVTEAAARRGLLWRRVGSTEMYLR